METYLLHGCVQLDALQKLMNVRKFLQESVVSYIILLNIPWASMACSCNGQNGIIMDGTQVAYKSLLSLLAQNWRVPPSNKQKPQPEAAVLTYLAAASARECELLHRLVLVYRRRDVKKKKTIILSK
jgi:hypothetical protein